MVFINFNQIFGLLQMAIKRQTPYIWVTWLTRLLVGEHSCEWSAWFKAQHEGSSWEKVPQSFDMTAWQVDHTALLREVREQLQTEGKTVYTEGQNSFHLRGNTATLGGKPDLIATSHGEGIIIDVKTGKHSPAHHVQVMVYMYAVPLVLRHFKGIEFTGRVIYRDKVVDIPASAIDAPFVDNLSSLVKRLSSPTPAIKVPNAVECGFCEITKTDCPERVAGDSMQTGDTSDF
jgi:hypothetical protein